MIPNTVQLLDEKLSQARNKSLQMLSKNGFSVSIGPRDSKLSLIIVWWLQLSTKKPIFYVGKSMYQFLLLDIFIEFYEIDPLCRIYATRRCEYKWKPPTSEQVRSSYSKIKNEASNFVSDHYGTGTVRTKPSPLTAIS